MLCAAFGRWLIRGSGHGRRRCGGYHRPGWRLRLVPRVLALDNRTLPSVFAVMNLDDSGAGSLRQAILDGVGGNGGAGQGAAFSVGGSITVYLEYVSMTGNQATGGSSGAGGQDGQGLGGGIYINPTAPVLGVVHARHTDISGNHASTSDDDVFGDIDYGE